MATVVETPKINRVNIGSFVAAEDLRTHQYKAVVGVGAASGKTTVKLNTTDGGRVVGILLNAPNTGEIADVSLVPNVAPWIAGAAFNCDIQLASTTAGIARAATSSDYVIGHAREASLAANHVIAVQISPYKI